MRIQRSLQTMAVWLLPALLMPDHECRECVYLPVCGGGCGSVSYNQSKTYHAPGCFKTKGVVEKQILHFVNEKIKTNVEVKK